jgi:hypothetical protein
MVTGTCVGCGKRILLIAMQRNSRLISPREERGQVS